MSRKNKKTGWITLGILILILGFGYFQYKNNVHDPIDSNDQTPISFQIKKGETAKEIGKNLEDKKIIRSANSFYLYSRIHGIGENIIAGRFLLKKSMNVPEILNSITDPKEAEFIITIQEGLTIRDIDDKLLELGLINSGDFLKAVKEFNGYNYYAFLDEAKLKTLELPLEGYLYPDTYFLDPTDFETKDLIYLALDNFEKKIAGLNPAKDRSFHEIIIMASIIENEVTSQKDRKLVSGILWKRLENGWPLGADATLLYITDDRKIDTNDLQIDSPYNTRKNLGLPPGPISSPGIGSIKAAIEPTTSDYWFYLTTAKTGEVIYSKTNEEHNLNRAKYL